MLDTIKVGLLRLDTKKDSHGYMRILPKQEGETILSHFRIPIHVVFDLEGYNSYNEYKRKENPEYKTWVNDIVLKVPPNPEKSYLYRNAGHEWFLGNLRELSKRYSCFPKDLSSKINSAVKEYSITKKKCQEESKEEVIDDYDEAPMNEAEKLAAYRATEIYGILQRSRFDPGRPEHKGEFRIAPFFRMKGDKPAKEIIDKVTQAVADYIWKSPKVSKYSETEGFGLKMKLSSLFLECFYKEQIRFMREKLEKLEKLNSRKLQKT